MAFAAFTVEPTAILHARQRKG